MSQTKDVICLINIDISTEWECVLICYWNYPLYLCIDFYCMFVICVKLCPLNTVSSLFFELIYWFHFICLLCVKLCFPLLYLHYPLYLYIDFISSCTTIIENSNIRFFINSDLNIKYSNQQVLLLHLPWVLWFGCNYQSFWVCYLNVWSSP